METVQRSLITSGQITDIISGSGILLTDVTDHFSPFLQCKGKRVKCNELIFTYRDYINANYDIICQDLRSEFNNLELEDNPNTAYNYVTSIITNVIDKNIPTKTVKVREKHVNKPWITPEILGYIKERHRLYKKFVKFPITYGTQYRKIRNKVNNMLSAAKTSYYETKFKNNAGNPKETWKLIDKIVNGDNEKNTSVQYLNINDTKVVDPHIISSYINCYFSNSGEE